MNTQPVKGAGFVVRALAHAVDLALVTMLAVMAMVPLALRAISQGMPPAVRMPLAVEVAVDLAFAAGVIALWRCTQTTPGKKLFGLSIVDWRNGKRPGWGQLTVRYLAYLVAYAPFPLRLLTFRWPELEQGMWGPLFQSWFALFPLGLGFLWVLVDPWNRGWHDLLSGTVTVATASGGAENDRREERGPPQRLIREREPVAAGEERGHRNG